MTAPTWEARDYEPMLRERLPAWVEDRLQASPVRLVGLESLSGGFSSESWMVKCVYPQGGGTEEIEFVLRWGPPGGIAAPYDIPGQFALLERLSKTSIPAPEPLWLERDPRVIGEPFLTMKLVPGEGAARYLPLDEPLREEKRLSHVRALASIHGLDWRRYGIDEVLAAPTPETCARVAIHDVVEKVTLRGHGANPDAQRAISWLYERTPARSEVRLIHGDPNHSNYRYEKGDVVAILDWEMAKLSDPLWDLAFVCTGMASRFRDQPEAISQREREIFLGRYQEATGRSLEDLLFWEVLFTLQSASGNKHPALARRPPTPSQWPRLQALMA